ncbi:DUF881 domain-containing protein [Natronosporangium hydrolyticum]|uniref:DUF881 domain-containing protein n=1 Tax=Natronosporangium hydrolyticum TaxID=2811111 RepID=A0A895YEE9_9ACTN|nr:DUF881 domain-containing protein [Natronosporangium hydrolyticum]QSB12600.1 DUF881 domain-containing protein [Natronosporangium hydrolyticum]
MSDERERSEPPPQRAEPGGEGADPAAVPAEPVSRDPAVDDSPGEVVADAGAEPAGGRAAAGSGWRRWLAPSGSPTGWVTVVLLALLGFTFTVQVRSVAEDPTVAALGQEDLVRILANLDAHEERLRRDIGELQETHRRLTSADESQQEALAEAGRRADELGILAGTLPAAGPGVVVEFRGGPDAVNAARVLDAVQELRSAGAEAMQVAGADGAAVRVVASTYFVDGEQGLVVDGESLVAPYRLTVIGEPETLAPALRIPGGVVESVQRDGGTVTVNEETGGVEVSAVREQAALEHARPDS